MRDAKTNPPPRSTPAPLDDGDARLRGNAAPHHSSGPPPGPVDTAPVSRSASPPGAGAPIANAGAPPGVSRVAVRAFLGRKDTQARIRAVVVSRVDRKTPKHVVDVIVQDANVRALETSALPRSEDRLEPWIATIARHAVTDSFRRGATDQRWLNREADVEELPPDPTDQPAELDAGAWMIGPWLEKRVANHARDRETLEILRDKARASKTYDQIAVERGMTVSALTKRVHDFKTKYLSLRQRYVKRRNLVIVLLLAAALVAILVIARSKLRARPIGPIPALPPSASASPALDRIPPTDPGVAHPRPH